MRLISGILLEEGKYQDVYSDICNDNDIEGNSGTSPISINEQKEDGKETGTIPTLQEVAQRDTKEEKTLLDEKQYIMYEILACSFLLNLIYGENDDEESFGLEQQLLNNALGKEKNTVK